jgi:hypothetical protein
MTDDKKIARISQFNAQEYFRIFIVQIIMPKGGGTRIGKSALEVVEDGEHDVHVETPIALQNMCRRCTE